METNFTTLPAVENVVFDKHLVLYLFGVTVLACIVVMCLFGAIRKQNPVYLFGRWIILKLRLCCNIKTETLEEESWQLNELLKDIENTRG